MEKIPKLLQLLDQRLVDLLPTRRVVDLNIATSLRAPVLRALRHGQNIGLAGFGSTNRHANLFGEHGELIDRGGAHQIAGHQHGRVALGFQQARQLRRRGCFSRAVEADHENASGLREIERSGIAAEQRTQLLVENFNDLLTGRHAAEHRFAKRFFLHPRDEILRDLEIYIRVEKGETHLAKGLGDIRLRDSPLPSQVFENILKLVGKSAKHGPAI